MHLEQFIRVALLFTGLYTLGSSEDLSCASYYNNLPSNEFNFQLSKNDFSSKNCSYESISAGSFRVPTIKVTNIQLTGKNSIKIWQTSAIGGVQYSTTITSSNFRNMSLVMDPGYIHFQFNILDNTKNDFFDIQAFFTNLTLNPNSTWLPQMEFGSQSQIINSLNLQPNTMSLYWDNSFSLQLVVSDKRFDVNILKKYYVYDDMIVREFQGTLYDIWKTSQAGGVSVLSRFSFLNLNPTVTDAFRILILRGTPAFPTFIQPLNQASAIETLSSVNSPKVIYEVAGSGNNVRIPTNFHNITVTGPGSVSIYAGCSSSFFEIRLLARIGSQNQSDFENLSIYGQCRTYLLKNVEVTWQKTRREEPNQSTKSGQHGVVMSNMYPYNENITYTLEKSIEYPEDADSFSVTYYVSDSSIHVFVEANQRAHQLPFREKTTISSTGAQIVSVDIQPYQTGTLVLYTVNSSVAFTSFSSMLALILVYLS